MTAAGKRARSIALPPFRPVQLAILVDTVPIGDRWLYEVKYDGYRLLVAIGGGSARAYTRSGLDWSDKFADVVAEAASPKVRSALLDGEAVVMDEDGRSGFQSLQGALKGAPGTIDFIAFDLLELDGEDLEGHTFVDYLRNQRGATAVMPYAVRARENAPVAVPITWQEMETIDAPNHYYIGDAAELLKRAGSKALSGWARAEQTLPDL